jgi:hypothetical protein
MNMKHPYKEFRIKAHKLGYKKKGKALVHRLSRRKHNKNTLDFPS